jgi:hypothetical protein
MLKKEENMVKLGVALPLKQMTAFEQCTKVNALTPLALNR